MTALVNKRSGPASPAEIALHAAEKSTESSEAGTGHGNNEEATEIARQLSEVLLSDRKEYISGGDSTEGGTHGKFVVYCQLNAETCAMIVRVPDLHHYKIDAKDGILKIAYVRASQILDEAGLTQIKRLAVATRGGILYSGVLDGPYKAHAGKAQALAQEVNHTMNGKELLPFFTPKSGDETVEPAPESPAPSTPVRL